VENILGVICSGDGCDGSVDNAVMITEVDAFPRKVWGTYKLVHIVT
jgi:hypothetical protein